MTIYTYKQKKKYVRKNSLDFLSKPRLIVCRSNKHIYAQLVNDKIRQTITSFSTVDKAFPQNIQTNTKIGAYFVGKTIGKKSFAKDIFSVVFDKKQRPYIGRIAALADGARAGGLTF